MDHNISSDPNANCDILFDELSNAKQLHTNTKRVKFNKRKHTVQPWINNVLLKKINKKIRYIFKKIENIENGCKLCC